MTTFKTTNPFNNEILGTYEYFTRNKVEQFIQSAHDCYESWKITSIAKRSQLMFKAAEILEANTEKYARTMTLEMGKTYKSALSEIEKCAWVCRYYAEKATDFLQDENVETDAQKSMIVYRPLGVILAVMPWNYPFWQVFRFAAPALMAGNCGILKHASNVPQSALYIQEVFEQAGFPRNCFTTLLIKGSAVENILQNPLVKAATLTGSEPAGSSVASISGNNIKPTILELGGSDPYLILEDADLELAADQCVRSRLLNAGQSCIGAKRFIVLEEIYEEFMKKFIQKMKNATIGDPFSNVDLGPMARHDLRDEVHEQVCQSVAKGASLILGGQIPESKGAFYPPTILTDVRRGMPAYEEEIFGPVASIIKVETEQEAIKVANDTKFGLGACVFTQNIERGERIAKYELEAGCCFVNEFVKSDPRLPFGGINASGYGRELSANGIRSFVNIKTVYIK